MAIQPLGVQVTIFIRATQPFTHADVAMTCFLRGLRMVPICGGWCDETVNPEVTPLRQFSNEKTVPRPCLWDAKCRAITESSACCRTSGRIGFAWAAFHRAPVMLVASAFSTAAWICILLSVLGLSTTCAAVSKPLTAGL